MANNDNMVENFVDLRICHVNSQSLYAHLDEFRLCFENSNFHIICILETWLKPSISDSMVSLKGYNSFRVDRVGKVGGGVAFYLHYSLNAKLFAQSELLYCRKTEFIIAEIACGYASRLLLAVVYRPPNYGYLQEFENTFLGLQATYRHSIIMGDFNTDMLMSSFDSGRMTSFIEASNMYLVPYNALLRIT